MNSTTRETLIKLCQLYPGNAGVNYETTTTENLALLAFDSAEATMEEMHKLWSKS